LKFLNFLWAQTSHLDHKFVMKWAYMKLISIWDIFVVQTYYKCQQQKQFWKVFFYARETMVLIPVRYLIMVETHIPGPGGYVKWSIRDQQPLWTLHKVDNNTLELVKMVHRNTSSPITENGQDFYSLCLPRQGYCV
jgi:hypothetical protein